MSDTLISNQNDPFSLLESGGSFRIQDLSRTDEASRAHEET